MRFIRKVKIELLWSLAQVMAHKVFLITVEYAASSMERNGRSLFLFRHLQA
jgi:hypothetical protein